MVTSKPGEDALEVNSRNTVIGPVARAACLRPSSGGLDKVRCLKVIS